MALTNQQVQQVFLAIAGRPAEGSAVAWGANSLSISALANMVVDVRKGADFANSKETFVENLYTQLLGRASDAEGKEFWLKALNDGVSYGDVLTQFITAVLAQSQTADIYTLQNKLSIAEKISAQVTTFQGGSAAEAQLKDIMSNVKDNTTIENIQDDLNTFEGQYSKVTSVTVKQGAEEATKGSEEHATNYNATLDYSKDGSVQIQGSTNYSDTLNLKAKGTDDTDKFTLSDVSNVSTINLDLSDAKIKTSEITTGDVAGLKNLTIKGTSEDTVRVNTKGATVDTGSGKDTINVEAASTIKAGAGDDTINLNGTENTTISIDGGAGKDTVTLGTDAGNDFKKLSLTSVEVLAGKGELSYATLNGKSFKLADNNTELSVSAKDKSGINLSSIKMDDDQTSGSITIKDVAKGTVTLSAKDATIAETIALTVTGNNKVTVNSFVTGEDKVKLAAGLQTDAVAAGTTKLNDAGTAAVAAGTAVDAVAKIIGDDGKVSTDLVSAFSAATAAFTAKDQKGYIAQVKDGKTSLYEIINDGTTEAEIDANDHVKLIATFDTALVHTDFIA